MQASVQYCGDDGQVYLSGVPDEGIVHVKWGDELDKQYKADRLNNKTS